MDVHYNIIEVRNNRNTSVQYFWAELQRLVKKLRTNNTGNSVGIQVVKKCRFGRL